MDVWLSLLFSLVLTGLVSFTIPLVLCFILVGSFNLFAQVNLMSAWADVVSVQLWDFFRTFGEGAAVALFASRGLLQQLACHVASCLWPDRLRA